MGGGKTDRQTGPWPSHAGTDVTWTFLIRTVLGSVRQERQNIAVNLGGKLVAMSWTTGFVSLHGHGMSYTPVSGLVRVVLVSQWEHKNCTGCADAVWPLRCRVRTSAGIESAQQYENGLRLTSGPPRCTSLPICISAVLPVCATGNVGK